MTDYDAVLNAARRVLRSAGHPISGSPIAQVDAAALDHLRSVTSEALGQCIDPLRYADGCVGEHAPAANPICACHLRVLPPASTGVQP